MDVQIYCILPYPLRCERHHGRVRVHVHLHPGPLDTSAAKIFIRHIQSMRKRLNKDYLHDMKGKVGFAGKRKV